MLNNVNRGQYNISIVVCRIVAAMNVQFNKKKKTIKKFIFEK